MGIMHGSEFLVLVILAFIILGPKQLPEYARKLARLVVQVRRMANDAKSQLKEQMGPEYEDLDWRQYDPRQYDPRRIVREALLEPLDEAIALGDAPAKDVAASSDEEPAAAAEPVPAKKPTGTPWDSEAT
ncbi:twin-arginine translocase TatA/TatE family subunit [Janibacter corallicola]|uniref:twin-arginine translocase TatA/TatE family subunit n=1 Tax=Janibacter corallicola TaxID=415212 RepID=UPI0008303E8D|nr:twin-arginine translocase TatA/TatE family subunit [Janibacter corallicola]